MASEGIRPMARARSGWWVAVCPRVLARSSLSWCAIGALVLLGGAASETVSAQGLGTLTDVSQVTAGGNPIYAHSCAIDLSGSAYCWGSNEFGQLGDGSLNRRTLATRTEGQSEPYSAISAGGAHTCSRGNSGQVYCWGSNAQRQLGVESSGFSTTPVTVPLPAPAIAISAASAAHTCAVLIDGRVSCWGSNAQGQLGGGNVSSVRVDNVALPAPASQVKVGATHSCALLSNGGVFCWGRNNAGQIGPSATGSTQPQPVSVSALPAPVSTLELGDFASCALLVSGAVYCWGSYTTTVSSTSTPRVVSGMASDVIGISVGGYGHLCASFGAGGMRCAGLNFNGQLGTGTITLLEEATPVVGLSTRIESFDAGYFHVCAVVQGETRCWGQDIYGELGRNDDALATTPGPVLGLSRPAVQIEGGGDHSCAIDNQGQISCWGDNTQGALGDGSTVTRAQAAPILASSAIRFSDVALGSAHSCALDDSGSVRCWGYNFFGQLGIGPGGDRFQPTPVIGLSDASSIASGLFHTCATTTGGLVFCWGGNSTGELGDGTTVNRNTPVPVRELPQPVDAVAAAFGHSCALTRSGAVLCWGSNFAGQLGRTTSGSLDPVPGPVNGLASGVEQIALGYALSCALLSSDRSVRCWGTGRGSTPQLVAGLESGVSRIAAGGGNRISGPQQQLCALMEDKSVRCMGSNKFGQLGDGTTLARGSALPVSGLGAASMIAVGQHHACSIDTSGAAACWGGNAIGQLGQGSFGVSPLPDVVVVDRSRSQIASASQDGNGGSASAVTDATGRYVVFESAASNLVSGDANSAIDIFRRDGSTGGVERVSVADDGSEISDDSIEPSVSAEGQWIVFVAPDTAVSKLRGESATARKQRAKGNAYGVFLRNMLTGSTQRVGTALPGGSGTRPVISPQGTSIAFAGLPAAPGQGTPGVSTIFVVPLELIGDELRPGLPFCPLCGPPGKSLSQSPSRNPVLSGDGRWLAFETEATNVAGLAKSCPQASSQILLRNLLTGSTVSASSPADPGQCTSGGAQNPSIDWSGGTIVFETDLPLDEEDRNGFSDIYRYDVVTDEHERVSTDPTTGDDGLDASTRPRISGDGKVVTFQSLAKNIESSEPDNNETNDIFVRNIETNSMRRVSRNRRGDQGNDESDGAALSWDGGAVVFASTANNLLLNLLTGSSSDSNGASDVFQAANPLVPIRKTGTWWVPTESGWGLSTIDQGNALGVSWFTYDTDGEPTWFSGSALLQPDGRFVGTVFRQTGVPLAEISGVATETSTPFANITLSFTGSGALTFDYAVIGGPTQRKQMSRFIFAGDDIVCRISPFPTRGSIGNLSDVWWGGAATSGWGLLLTESSSIMAATWYTFDQDREAVFLIAITTRQPDGSYAGAIFRQRNGTPFGNINGAPPSSGADAIGTARFDIIDGETADFSYTVGAVTQTRRISRFVFGTAPNVCSTARP